jgi:hypothetical protein
MNWLLLVHSLPGQNGALRVGVWRNLGALGAGSLRDGVFVLPDRPDLADAFAAIRASVVASGGTAHVLPISGAENPDAEFRALFDRSEAYDSLIAAIESARSVLHETSEPDARRSLRQLVRELARIDAIDFFASAGRERAHALLATLTAVITKTFSPDEPVAIGDTVALRQREEFRGRLWVTRKRMWVDRVASAWLIARFIDSTATFAWPENVDDAPAHAVGYDYDGATFTHVGDLSTFEVLLASFDLGNDGALTRIAAMVHALDIGGLSIAEGPGFEAVLAGMRDRTSDDAELREKMSDVLDAFYTAFGGDVVAEA